MLPANSLQELHVGIRPMSANRCSQLMYINVVDVELHQVSHALPNILSSSLLTCFISTRILLFVCSSGCIVCLPWFYMEHLWLSK